MHQLKFQLFTYQPTLGPTFWAVQLSAPSTASTIPDLKHTLGAFHVSELFFVFGHEDSAVCDW